MKNLNEALALFRAVQVDFPSLSEDSFREVLVRNIKRQTALGAFEDGILTGLAVYSPPLKRLSFLAVPPKYRGKGYGKALTQRILELLGGEAELFTYKPDPACPRPAYLLYRSLGFREDGEEEGFRAEVIRMIKEK